MNIKDSFGYKPVKESFNLDGKKDIPMPMQRSSYGEFNELIPAGLKGVINGDKALKNKSDLTQRGEK